MIITGNALAILALLDCVGTFGLPDILPVFGQCLQTVLFILRRYYYSNSTRINDSK